MNDQPSGEVTVELFDERGRCTQREQGPNFISKLAPYHHRSMMRRQWNAYSLNKAAAYSVEGLAEHDFFCMPDSWIACWNDTSAESAATEHQVRTDGNNIIACASIWPFGTAGAIRGQVNISESTWTPGVITRVFDWTTAAGNGTFQSVGYTAMQPLFTTGGAAAGTTPSLLVQPSYDERRRVTDAANTLFSWITGTGAGTGYASCWCDPANGDIYIAAASNSSATPASSVRIYKLTNAQVNTAGVHDGWGCYNTAQTPSLVLTTFAPTSFFNNLSMAPVIAGKLGADWVITYTTSTNWRWAVINGTTGATIRSVALPVSGMYSAGVMIGNTLYVHSGAQGVVYTYDATTGTQGTSITFPTFPPGLPASASNVFPQMTTDGTDLYLTVGTANGASPIFRMTTAGVVTQVIGLRQINSVNEVSTTPYASASRSCPPLSLIETGDSYVLGNLSTNVGVGRAQTAGFNVFQMGTTGVTLMWRNSALWISNAPPTNGLVPFWGGPIGWNLGSRVLLGAPITKTSAQTMKITYTLNLPTVVP